MGGERVDRLLARLRHAFAWRLLQSRLDWMKCVVSHVFAPKKAGPINVRSPPLPLLLLSNSDR